MFKFNRRRTRIVALCMYVLAAISTILTIGAISVGCATTSYVTRCDRISIGGGIWGVVFIWPSAIMAHLASQKNSPRCLIIGHLTMCVLSAVVTTVAIIVDSIFLDIEWSAYDTNDHAFNAMLIISTLSLFALMILSIISAGFSCHDICCRKQSRNSSQNVNSSLIGLQVIKNGEMRYFPASNREVSEISTENGKMIVLNIVDQTAPSTSTEGLPTYESVSNNNEKPTQNLETA